MMHQQILNRYSEFLEKNPLTGQNKTFRKIWGEVPDTKGFKTELREEITRAIGYNRRRLDHILAGTVKVNFLESKEISKILGISETDLFPELQTLNQ